MSRVLALVDPRSPRGRHLLQERVEGLRLELLDWRDVLEVGGRLEELPACRGPGLLRIDSPDKHPDVVASLLRRGGYRGPWPTTRGQWRSPAAQHRGFVAILEAMAASLEALPLEPWLTPAAIVATFDKEETRRRLRAASLPTCEAFAPTSFGALWAELQRRRWPRAYLKLRHGWSGTGIVCIDEGGRAVSTLVQMGGAFFNTRRLEAQPLEELEGVVERIIVEGATCERGVLLEEVDGDAFDVRMVVVEGEVPFRVFRRSPVPITNLHLVGRRADPERCLRVVGRRRWADAVDAARRAALCFEAPVVGVDVAFERGGGFAILEVNAFGDFLPRLTDGAGRTVHRVVLEAMAAHCSSRG